MVRGFKLLEQMVMEIFGPRKRWTPWIKKLKMKTRVDYGGS